MQGGNQACTGRTSMVVASGTNSFAKEMAIRKRISNIYNKREEDFPSLREYNDYLEEVEDMTCKLIEDFDVPAIEAKTTKYEQENYDQIMNAACRRAGAALAASKGPPAQTDSELATSQSSQASFSGVPQGQYAPAVAGGAFAQPRPTGMTPQPLPLGGGPDMQLDDEEMMKLRAEKGGRSGGWSPEFSRKRALEEAFGSLWI